MFLETKELVYVTLCFNAFDWTSLWINMNVFSTHNF
jgi:hypothetical protein